LIAVKYPGDRGALGRIKDLLMGTTLDKHGAADQMHSMISVSKSIVAKTTEISEEEKQKILERLHEAECKLYQFHSASR
jgi:hypothetical protein